MIMRNFSNTWFLIIVKYIGSVYRQSLVFHIFFDYSKK